MKKTLSLLFLFLSIFPLSAHAAPLKILFFYPGGQGDQASAQPILDSFSESLKKNSGGQLEAKVTYISDSAQGRAFIQNEKPSAAMLSVDSYLKYGNAWGAKVIAKALQIPSGDGSDQYFILGKKGATLPNSGNLVLVSPREIEVEFVTGKLFPQLKGTHLSVQASQNTVGTLRGIGSGTKEGLVLLDQFEYANLSQLKTPWAANLELLATSPKVSSAPFVVFPNQASSELIAMLGKALLQMTQDPGAAETLGTLRLKGFKAATALE